MPLHSLCRRIVAFVKFSVQNKAKLMLATPGFTVLFALFALPEAALYSHSPPDVPRPSSSSKTPHSCHGTLFLQHLSRGIIQHYSIPTSRVVVLFGETSYHLV